MPTNISLIMANTDAVIAGIGKAVVQNSSTRCGTLSPGIHK